jgi:phenylacetate-coenzyme A ligase PaaK-like adenylate-forming protein
LQMLVDEARAGRLDIHPYRVWTCGEPLYPEIAAAAEGVFGVAISDLWGMSEGAYAGSCGQGEGMHLPDDLTWIEPVDAEGRPVPAGARAAKFLFTNLYNHALPLIRYEVSDEIMLLEDPCPCGSGHRRMAGVLGRRDDLFRYGKVTIHPQLFRSPLGREANVIEYRVTQTRSGAQIALCTRGPVDLARLGSVIREGLADAGLAAPEVEIQLMVALERQVTGKLKRFIPLQEVRVR